MSRLIDADEAIDYVNNLITVHRYYHPRSTTENFPISEVIARINEVPTVDAVPVVHGHWIQTQAKDENGNAYYSCSVCGSGECHVPEVNVPYCWKCGSKMDEVTE